MKRADRLAARREAAALRQASYDALTVDERLERARGRRGHSQREVTKLMRHHVDQEGGDDMAQIKKNSSAAKAARKGAIVAIPKKGESYGDAVKRVAKKHPGAKVVPNK